MLVDTFPRQIMNKKCEIVPVKTILSKILGNFISSTRLATFAILNHFVLEAYLCEGLKFWLELTYKFN